MQERLSQVRGCGFAIRRDCAYYCVYADGCALGDFDFLQNSGGGRGNFGVDLVGGDFKERLIALDFVARLLQPFSDSAFDNGFAHLGHDDVCRHDFLPRGPRFGTEGRMQTDIITGAGVEVENWAGLGPLSDLGLVLLFILFAAWGSHAEGGLPVFLHGWRKFFHVREEGGDLPHILLTESFVP